MAEADAAILFGLIVKSLGPGAGGGFLVALLWFWTHTRSKGKSSAPDPIQVAINELNVTVATLVTEVAGLKKDATEDREERREMRGQIFAQLAPRGT